MKFDLKAFRQATTASLEEISRYLSQELASAVRSLNYGLTRLTFGDNFESFEESVTIAAGEELAIRNRLPGGAIPSRRLVVRGGNGSQDVTDGDNEWTRNYVYLKNNGASQVTLTVLFLR